MTIQKLEGLLTAIEILNNGLNHGCEYAIYQLPESVDLSTSLDQYFSKMCTSRSPAQPAEHWHIQTKVLGLNWESALSERLMYWFFDEEYSPKVDEWIKKNFVAQTLEYMRRVFGEPEVFEVLVNPPIWYDCQWQDFAFTSPAGKWLVHLGFSD